MSDVVRCSACKWWREVQPEGRDARLENLDAGDLFVEETAPWELFPRDENDEPVPYSYRVGECMSPRFRHLEGPTAPDEAATFDASDYKSVIYTAEQFGCVLGEPADLPSEESGGPTTP